MSGVDPGLIALLILAPIILLMIVLCYIAHKHTEYFESFLPNCTYVTGNKKIFQHAGLLGKVMRTGSISLVLAIPTIFLRRGLIDLNEVKRFPPNMKRLLVSMLAIQIVLLIALTISHYADR
ncbi:hypothetical protein [Pseudomonas sp. WHRI 8519]|uniref:hypothetical protein n=1 Tax=Pseudomonas sp. WHRI 8519 TaxID=3162567 RepID=UPI0032EF187B